MLDEYYIIDNENYSMRETYQSVYTSLFASALLCGGIIIYYFIYPRRKISPKTLLMLLAILPVISVFRPGTYESGSLSDYVKFSYSFYQSLLDGIRIPRWDPNQCGSYGCPLFLYMYILPYYVIALFHTLGLTLINSVKTLLVLSYLSSGITIYLLTKNQFGKKAALIAGIFYLFTPYHLSDFHFSNDIGEMLAFAILPISLLTGIKTVQSLQRKWTILFGLSLAALLLSHHVIAILSSPLLLGYIIISRKTGKKKPGNPYARLFVSILISVLLTTFYWLPILIESQEILWGKYGTVSFITPINMFLYSPWRYGLLFQGPKGELSFAIGYTHLLFFVIAGIYFIKRKIQGKEKQVLGFCLLISLFYFFMLQPQSKIIWETIPLIKKSQLTYRLLIPIALTTSVIAGIILKHMKNTMVIIICFITIFSTILNWGNRRVIPQIDDNYLIYELLNREPVAELVIPNWVKQEDLVHIQRPITHLETLQGKTEMKEIKRTSTKHEYLIYVTSNNAVMKENTFYYSGWNLFVNNQYKKIVYRKKGSEGFIVFSLNKGLNKIEIAFLSTKIRAAADYISGITLLFLLLYCCFHVLTKQKRKKGFNRYYFADILRRFLKR